MVIKVAGVAVALTAIAIGAAYFGLWRLATHISQAAGDDDE
jgi:hypothetical protein